MPKHQKSKAQLWLALKLVPRLAVHKKITLINEITIEKLFNSSTALSPFSLSPKQISAIAKPNWEKIDQIIALSKQCHSEILTYDDKRYPQILKQAYDPPLVLFVKGDANLLNTSQLAIVGSRNATSSGREIAKNIANEVAKHGICITSGLAIGIDANAHSGAIGTLGNTIAVVATGLDKVYPSRHSQLVNKILISGGAIVSEFPPGTLPKPGHFPKRNRIISGMSIAVLVVEATIKSGSLVTARSAIEQNREVFAMPGSIFNEQSKGCHWLIKQGAKLIENAADIKEELPTLFNASLYSKDKGIKKDERKEIVKSEKQSLSIDPLLASVGYEITPVDIVVSRSELPTDVVLTRLMMLELRGLVSAVPGGYLRIN